MNELDRLARRLHFVLANRYGKEYTPNQIADACLMISEGFTLPAIIAARRYVRGTTSLHYLLWQLQQMERLGAF